MITDLHLLKALLREDEMPFFTDEQLELYLSLNNGNFNSTIHQCFMVKSEETTLSLSGLSTADTSKYFRRLAAHYRPTNSGVLKGGV